MTIAIIGGGPGGYVAAIRAAGLGAEVTLVEADRLGGTCLNRGCIPTKSLLHTAGLLRQTEELERFGLEAGAVRVNWPAVQARKARAVDGLTGGVAALMRANGVRVLAGRAELLDARRVRVAPAEGGEEVLEPDRIIIATGSQPAMPPIPGLAESPACIDSTAALELGEVPGRLAVIGGGVIGIEMAYLYRAFGAQVTVIEALDSILPQIDGELTRQLRRQLEKLGISIHTGARVTGVSDGADGSTVHFTRGGEKHDTVADKILVAVGRRPDTGAIHPERAGIALEGGRIVTDSAMGTSVPHIYAVGDCTSPVMLAHAASAQGEVAAENAVGGSAEYDGGTCPSCVYTEPELAGVGATEEALKASGAAYTVGKFPLSANGKALVMGGSGTVKLLAEAGTGRVLGLHILGPRATDLIAQGALAIAGGMTAEDLERCIYAHPTLGEAVREAAMAGMGRAVHIRNPRRR